MASEKSMVAEDRIARLESDIGELKSDVKTLNARVSESIIANAKEFGGLKMEMEKGFGALKTEIAGNRADGERGLGTLRTEMEKGFGALRTEIEKNRADTEKSLGSLKSSIESAKLWMLVTGVGSVILVTFVSFLGRALKIF
jgi:uncharacterized small protein (DUF1192 family)